MSLNRAFRKAQYFSCCVPAYIGKNGEIKTADPETGVKEYRERDNGVVLKMVLNDMPRDRLTQVLTKATRLMLRADRAPLGVLKRCENMLLAENRVQLQAVYVAQKGEDVKALFKQVDEVYRRLKKGDLGQPTLGQRIGRLCQNLLVYERA